MRHPPLLHPVGKCEGSRKIQGCSKKGHVNRKVFVKTEVMIQMKFLTVNQKNINSYEKIEPKEHNRRKYIEKRI